MVKSETVCAQDGLYKLEYTLVEERNLYGLQITETYDCKQKEEKTLFPLSDKRNEILLLQEELKTECVFLVHIDAVLEDMGYFL